MKPYIISAFSNPFEANRYWWSLDASLGDSVRPITLMYKNRGKFDKCDIPKYATVIKADKNYPGNTGRHKDLYNVLKQLEINKNAWCIFTDVHDVVFQAPLPKLPEDADVLVCNEGKIFRDIEFWKMKMPKRMWDYPAYNSGVWAMRYSVLMDYWKSLMNQWDKFYVWYKTASLPKIIDQEIYLINVPELDQDIKDRIAMTFNSYHDTIGFINFLQNKPLRIKEVSGLFACYAFNYEMGTIYQKEGKTYNQNHELVSIVHYNGCFKYKLKEVKTST